TYTLDGDSLDIDGLNVRLAQIYQQDTTMYVRVRADENAQHGNVVRVLDIANQHKMNIVIATEKSN
ncbi:MAG: biopolymer transporter ExbD, partial [Bacteroidales bacterium]|nr:biopolymer transporter ExbD [Bacteroidales bacterium]